MGGIDYPIFSSIIQSHFSCKGTVNGEYYADVETQCQMFHVCSHLANGLAQRFSFLCPNGTMFHQQLKICHWWFFVDCDSSKCSMKWIQWLVKRRKMHCQEGI